MANLVKWLEKAVDPTQIQAVVIGEMGWGKYKSDLVPTWKKQERGKVLSWDEARPLLDYEFDDGCGAPGCNAVYVWTPNTIFFVSQYDGSTKLAAVPRHPIDCTPTMPGG